MRTLAAMSPVYKEVAESMATSNIEPAEVSMARYHDRYVSGMRGSYAAGWDARQEEVNAITDKLDTAEKKLDVTEKKLERILFPCISPKNTCSKVLLRTSMFTRTASSEKALTA